MFDGEFDVAVLLVELIKDFVRYCFIFCHNKNIVNITSKETNAQFSCNCHSFEVVHHKRCKKAAKSTSDRQPLYLLKLLVIESKASHRKNRRQYQTDMLSLYVVVMKLLFC